MGHKSDPPNLFFRWLMVVYLPLGLLLAGAALLPFRLLPRTAAWLLMPLAAYGVLAVRLLIERKKAGIGIPLPRRILVSAAVLAAMAASGASLFTVGMGRLTTSTGLAMVLVGSCLMILSITVPAFRLVDIVLRKIARLFARLLAAAGHAGRTASRPGSPRPLDHPARPVHYRAPPQAPDGEAVRNGRRPLSAHPPRVQTGRSHGDPRQIPAPGRTGDRGVASLGLPRPRRSAR